MKGLYVGLMLLCVLFLMAGGLMRWVAFLSYQERPPFRSAGDKWGFWISVLGVVGMIVLTVIYESFFE